MNRISTCFASLLLSCALTAQAQQYQLNSPDGKLIVTSSDPQALAAMEDLVAQLVAPRRSFKVFRLKYATPSWVTSLAALRW